MKITNTDRKFINLLFDQKPNATGYDVVKLIEKLNKTNLNSSMGQGYIKSFIREESKTC